MAKKSFNTRSSEKMSNYHIELSYPKGADVRTQLLVAANFKGALGQWIGEETGVLPDLQSLDKVTYGPGVSIHCTEGFIQKIEAQFHKEIAKVTKIKPAGLSPAPIKVRDDPKGRSDYFKKRRGL